jgi:hypothetical protein
MPRSFDGAAMLTALGLGRSKLLREAVKRSVPDTGHLLTNESDGRFRHSGSEGGLHLIQLFVTVSYRREAVIFEVRNMLASAYLPSFGS